MSSRPLSSQWSQSFLALLLLAGAIPMRCAAAEAQESGAAGTDSAPTSVRSADQAAGRAIPRTAGPAIQVATIAIAAPADPSQVGRYAKVELLVSLTNVAATAFAEPDPTRSGIDLEAIFTSPSGATWTIPGFWDGAAWRVRFAPNEIGAWQASVSATDASGSASLGGVTFTCVTSSSPGWLRIAGSHLASSEGVPFWGIGHNNGYQDDVEQPTLPDMAARGENLLSFWMSAPFTTTGRRVPIENASGGIGNYDQGTSAYIDQVVADAEAAGVVLLPTIWPHDQLRDALPVSFGRGDWSTNNGYAAICQPEDFFAMSAGGVETPQWHAQHNFLRYVLARWGASVALAGWVGVAEVDGTTGFAVHPDQATAWCAAVRTWFATHDPYRNPGLAASGKYPVTFSRSDVDGVQSAAAFSAAFDLRAMDSYLAQTNDSLVVSQSGITGNLIAGETALMQSLRTPRFHTEFGGDVVGTGDRPPPSPRTCTMASRAALASGAAITPLLWCDDGDFPLLTDQARHGVEMRDQLHVLADFVHHLPDVFADFLTLGTPSLPANTFGTCMQLDASGFGWVQTTAGTMGGRTFTLPFMPDGEYVVHWFDPWTDGANPGASTIATAAGNNLAFAVPATGPGAPSLTGRPDVAFVFRRRAQATSQTIQVVTGVPQPITLSGTTLAGGRLSAIVSELPTAGHGTLTQFDGTAMTAIPTAVSDGTLRVVFTSSGAIGTDDTFTFHVNDGFGDSADATITLVTVPDNVASPPTADPQHITTPNDRALGIVLTGNDHGAPLTLPAQFIDLTVPAHGTLTGTAPWLTYTPQAGYVGDDLFTFQVFNGFAPSPAATIVVTTSAPSTTSTNTPQNGVSAGHCGLGAGFAALALTALGGMRRRQMWRCAR